jgi:hypothetical protein
LKGQCPDDTGYATQDKFFTDDPSIDDGTEYIKRGSSNVSVNDSKCDEQPCCGYFVQLFTHYVVRLDAGG